MVPRYNLERVKTVVSRNTETKYNLGNLQFHSISRIESCNILIALRFIQSKRYDEAIQKACNASRSNSAAQRVDAKP
ncbi:unnamed protein product [Sphenostylis stenocarpa]|uniref:Uncharacterized protein n=1 Tax=Sphenostylis stenocarpa TaxID=92480 RepID=A0AA86S0L1_9FABA|nr:unnamed protein product [Sphenostylis stenocarpa]